MQSSQATPRTSGVVSLFLGIETYPWDIAQFQHVAHVAHAQGIETLFVKVADGAVHWHGGLGTSKAIQAAMRDEGITMIPYLYSYGQQQQAFEEELQLLTTYLRTFGTLCLQLEEAWNDQPEWAEHLRHHLQEHPGTLLVACLPDPVTQQQTAVLQTLDPVVKTWVPRISDPTQLLTWQAQAQTLHLRGDCLPLYHLSASFGLREVEDPLLAQLAQFPQAALWDYRQAVSHDEQFAHLLHRIAQEQQRLHAQAEQAQQQAQAEEQQRQRQQAEIEEQQRQQAQAEEQQRQQAEIEEQQRQQPVEEEEEVVSISIATPIIQEHFEAIGSGWQVKNALDANGDPIVLRGEILEHYCTQGSTPYGGFSSVGLPMTNELPIERFGSQYGKFAQKGIVIVFFERGVWIYDPTHLVDAPYGSGAVYPLKLYDNGLGRDPSINKLNADLLLLQQQLQQAQQSNAPLTILQQIKSLLVPVL
jgi:hypothetical protein